MQTITIDQITEQLEKLSPEKLPVVYDFVSFLLDREAVFSEVAETMLMAEPALRRDWDRPEEDEAWADL